jgi:ribosome-associated translation inhibitor RaiA
MQIHITGSAPSVTQQMQAYAEYKVFSQLAPLAARVATVQVVVAEPEEGGGDTVCVITADLGGAGYVRTRARGAHLTRVIDVAAGNVARSAARRLAARHGEP